MNTGAPDCFAATNVAVGISFVPFYAMDAWAPDGEITIARTYAFTSLISIQSASPVSSPNYMTLVRGGEGTNTEVGMDFITNLGPLEYRSLRKTPLRGPSLLQPMVLPLIVFVVYCKCRLGRQMFHPSGYPFVSRRYNAFPRNPCKALVAKWIHHQWQHGGILYPNHTGSPSAPLGLPLGRP